MIGKCQNCDREITVRIIKFVSDKSDILIKEVELPVSEEDLVCEACHT